jgi:hypothetical protein
LTNAAIGVLGAIAKRDSVAASNIPKWPHRRHDGEFKYRIKARTKIANVSPKRAS